MISSINVAEVRNQKLGMLQNASSPKKVQESSNRFNGYSLASSNALKAMNSVSFTGINSLTNLEQSFIRENEVRIPNILGLKEDILMDEKQMPEKTAHLNSEGLNVRISRNSTGAKTYEISNNEDNQIAHIEVSPNAKNLPVITYKQGKFMPELTIKDTALQGKAIKMLAGSKLETPEYKIVMPGKFRPNSNTKHKEVSFTGNIAITTLNKEDRTVNAVEKFMNGGFIDKVTMGKYVSTVKKHKPTLGIPAGGFGERLVNITRGDENKPSAHLPTDTNYRIMGTTLALGVGAGIIEGKNKDNIVYLSQKHDIERDNKNVYWTEAYKTDGGAIAEGLKRNIIDSNSDVIILNADIFTNADVTRPYHALKTLPNAALIIPYYPVNAQRAKSFGLLGIEEDKNGNMQIKEFVEKPKYTDKSPKAGDFNSDQEYNEKMSEFLQAQKARNPQNDEQFLANPGMYFLSKEAVDVLKSMGILTPDKTFLGKNIMPKIIELINTGKLVDKEGNPMKAYTVPLERADGKPAIWDDIGTAEAYLSIVKDVATEVETNGTGVENKYYGVPKFVMKDFRANTDLNTGIVYDSKHAQDALQNFKEKRNVSQIYGNIYVAGHVEM